MKRKISTYNSLFIIRTLSVFLLTFFVLSLNGQVNINPHLNTGNYSPISSVVYTINGNDVVQNSPATSGNENPGSTPVFLKRINATKSPSDPTQVVLDYFNFENVTIKNLNLTAATTGVGVYYDGTSTMIHNNVPAFLDKLSLLVTDANIRSKVWYDNPGNLPCNTLPPDCTTQDFDIQFSRGFLPEDYMLVGERWGNSTFSLRALDANGNEIGSTLTFGGGGGGAYQKYDWNTGYSMTYQSGQAMAFTVIPASLFNAGQTVFGLRIFNSVDQADVKFFGLSDNTFDDNPVNPSVTGITGTVFHDINGLTDATVNGTGIGSIGPDQLYVNLLNGSNQVVATKPANANGTYVFFAIDPGTYTVQVSLNEGVTGQAAPAVSLPAGWVNTGENQGSGAGSDGTIDSKLTVSVMVDEMTTDVNFGMQQLPVPSIETAPELVNPGGNNAVAVPAATFQANDTDGEVVAILITEFPSNTTTITINGVEYTSATFPVAGVEVPASANGNPTQAILVDPIDGAVTVSIPFKAKDNAGFLSDVSGEANQPFTVPDGPTAIDDEATTSINTPVNLDILDNDIEGSTPLVPGSIVFINGTEPDPVTVGVFTVDLATGIVTFTPANNYVGVATIDYQVCDQNSLCDIATITVTIISGTTNLYPAAGPGTLAFEDLWPAKGDYDFNDLVIDYQFLITTNTSNMVEEIQATFTIKAFGASFENGFGFQLSENIDADDLTVSGYSLTENFITLNPNGTEDGQSKPTIIVYDNAFNEMPHPGIGIGVNTEPSAPYVAPKTLVITISVTPNKYNYNQLDIANFNPFIIVNKNRAVEVHLPNFPPTDLADQGMFGQWDDDSDAGTGKYYLTANNLPWAINIYESFDWPIEKQDITWVHLKFAEWAVSGGVLYPNWYQNITGFRNNSLIYQVPSN
jgi:LruC domain-containing protein